jgi:hypothetical protein
LSKSNLDGLNASIAGVHETDSSMDYSTYIKNFKGRKVPAELENLIRAKSDIDILSAELYEAGVYFRFLEDSDSWLTYWLGYQSQIVDSVLGIATNGAGDLLAFWLYDERDLKDAPIVFIGDGDPSIIANNFSDMLLLLVACFDLHPDAIPEDLQEDFEDPLADEITLALVEDGTYPPDTIQRRTERREEIKQGRAKFIAKLGIQPPEYPAALMRKAIQAHPDFQTWLDEQALTEQPLSNDES